MRVAVFSTKPYDRQFLQEASRGRHELTFFENRLREDTAPLAQGHDAVCAFVQDDLGKPVVEILAGQGVRYVVLRCAGFNQVDLKEAARQGIRVARVPAYSPEAVAEHAVALIQTLNRKTHRAFNRVREGNFSLDGLVGFDLHGKTVGIVGTGKIGAAFVRIMHGFGCRLLAFDIQRDEALERGKNLEYVEMDTLLGESDIISLHCPLNKHTRHMIDASAVARMKQGVMLINTSRGGLVDTPAVIDAIKKGRIGSLGLDVYEEEAGLFFEDRSATIVQDDILMRLMTFPNVLITGHQGFFTQEALGNIARTTLSNLDAFDSGSPVENEVSAA